MQGAYLHEAESMGSSKMQEAHKPVRTREVILFMQRRIMPPMEIHAISRLTPSPEQSLH